MQNLRPKPLEINDESKTDEPKQQTSDNDGTRKHDISNARYIESTSMSKVEYY